MKTWADDLRAFLDEEMKACQAREDVLSADLRADEADLEKVRANVYGIFKTLLDSAERKAPGGMEKQWFTKKLQQIPMNWQAALVSAHEHADAKRVMVEEAKLKAVRKIRERVERGERT